MKITKEEDAHGPPLSCQGWGKLFHVGECRKVGICSGVWAVGLAAVLRGCTGWVTCSLVVLKL